MKDSKKKIIELDDIPLSIRKKWDKENFDIRKARALKIKKKKLKFTFVKFFHVMQHIYKRLITFVTI